MTRPLQHQSARQMVRPTDPLRFAHARDQTTLLVPFPRHDQSVADLPRHDIAAGACARRALIAECADRLMAPRYDADSLTCWIEQQADISAVDKLLDIYTQTARRMGDLWLEDVCTFADVTIGMHRLTMLLVALEPPHADPSALAQHGGRVLLAPAPGDQHGFGLAMVGFCLRRAGWDVRADVDSGGDQILSQVAAREYDVVGFSIGHERAIGPVGELIAQVRRRSRNPRIRVVLGGPMLIGRPELAEAIGADFAVEDAAELVERIAPFIPAALI